MKYLLVLLVSVMSVTFNSSILADEEKKIIVNCETGPLTKEYGKTSWLVYSCDNKTSMLIISAIDNPAMPFYFTLHETKDGYQLSGEGTGKKETTAAAYDDLKKLSKSEILDLIKKTKTAKKLTK